MSFVMTLCDVDFVISFLLITFVIYLWNYVLTLCDVDFVILNLVIIVIWIMSFGLHMIICYACITLEIILAASILNIQGIPCQKN
jgi:hypothetical protein